MTLRSNNNVLEYIFFYFWISKHKTYVDLRLYRGAQTEKPFRWTNFLKIFLTYGYIINVY